MSKHTPTPWRLEYHPGQRGEPATLIMQEGAEACERWIAECPWGLDGDGDGDCSATEAQANAAFIVRACNAHGDLIAACRAAEQFIRNGVEYGYIRMPDKDTPDKAHDTLPTLEAAIAKAEKPLQPTLQS